MLSYIVYFAFVPNNTVHADWAISENRRRISQPKHYWVLG